MVGKDSLSKAADLGEKYFYGILLKSNDLF
jgi:hypothetical protein